MIISIDKFKKLIKFNIASQLKLNQLSIEETYLNVIKDIYYRSIANITLNGETLKALSGIRMSTPTSPIQYSNGSIRAIGKKYRGDTDKKGNQIIPIYGLYFTY